MIGRLTRGQRITLSVLEATMAVCAEVFTQLENTCSDLADIDRRRLRPALQLTRLASGEFAGFWCLYQPGRSFPGVTYGGRPLLMLKIGSVFA